MSKVNAKPVFRVYCRNVEDGTEADVDLEIIETLMIQVGDSLFTLKPSDAGGLLVGAAPGNDRVIIRPVVSNMVELFATPYTEPPPF